MMTADGTSPVDYHIRRLQDDIERLQSMANRPYQIIWHVEPEKIADALANNKPLYSMERRANLMAPLTTGETLRPSTLAQAQECIWKLRKNVVDLERMVNDHATLVWHISGDINEPPSRNSAMYTMVRSADSPAAPSKCPTCGQSIGNH